MNDKVRTWAEWYTERYAYDRLQFLNELEQQKIIDEWYAPSKEEDEPIKSDEHE